jgi:outer membrane protein TolC
MRHLLILLPLLLHQAAPGATPIPSAQAMAAMVPTSGKLGERELTLMAIAHRPDLQKQRGAISTATAQQRAAHDLENPELRLSYSQDNDDRIGEPYTESETVLSNTAETFDTRTSGSSLVVPGGAESTTSIEQGSTSNSRFRQIEREVTPGATKDVVVERVYETNSSSTSSSRLRHDTKVKGPSTTTGFQQETENRRLIGTTRREIEHPDTSGRDNAFGLLLRFKLPHPWERKARIQRAAAEISLAEAEYYASEDTVVRTVRAAFQELSILQSKLTSQQARKAGCEAYRDWLEARKVPKLGLDLATARAKVYHTIADIRSLEGELSAMRGELAAYCGLADASRIEPSIKTRHITDSAALDIAYLTRIATLYRSDVLGDQARLAIARAELAEAKARRIPFTTFVDFGYSEVNSLRRTGQKGEWFGRVGISIPLWDWIGMNKQHQVHQAASESLELKIDMQRKLITTEINQAVQRLAAAEEQLSRQSKDLGDLRTDLKKSMDDAQMATLDVDDLAKSKRIEQEFADLAQQMELSRFTAVSAYQQALMSLEKALGIRLERALSKAVGP